MVECKCGYVTSAEKAATLGLGRVVKPKPMTPEQIAFYEKCAAEQSRIMIPKPFWSEEIAEKMFDALDKRGFHMESSDLGVDDMKAVFEAIFDEPESV